MKNFKNILLIIIIGSAILMSACKKEEEDNLEDEKPTYNLVDNYSIIVYGNTGCSYCDNLEVDLEENNISYTFYNISTNTNKMSEMFEKLRSIGYYDSHVDLPVVDITTDSTHILIQPDFETEVIPLITE